MITSDDGTKIAWEAAGTGPALVLVDGAMCHRGGPMRPLAGLLARHFTVYTYDRRGRGESGDTPPYAVQREVEDLHTVIRAAGGSAGVYAMSSGAALALRAAFPGITKLALYEPPFLGEVEDGTRLVAYTKRLTELLDEGRRGDAVELFMTHVGIPPEFVQHMRSQPHWAAFEAIAPTLAYDDLILGDGRVPAHEVTMPTLVLSGGASPENLRHAAKAAAAAIPGSEHRILDGQTHDPEPAVLAAVLTEFFTR